MDQLFQQEFTFTLTGTALLGVVLFFIVASLALVILIFSLIRKIQILQKPKYGFLGKPVFSVLALVGIATTMIYFSYSFSNQPDFQISANRTVNASIEYRQVGISGTKKLVEFRAVPVVDNREYGLSSDRFEILWRVNNVDGTERIEYERTKNNPSAVYIELDPGSYTVSAIIVFEGKSYQFVEPVIINP